MRAQFGIQESEKYQKIFRFLIVGIGGTLVDFGLLTGLKLLGFTTLLANTISFTGGLINNFYWNSTWTFQDARKTNWRVQFMQYGLISLVGLAMNNAIVLGFEGVFNKLFGFGEWGYIPAKILATGIVVVWNYWANAKWTFQQS